MADLTPDEIAALQGLNYSPAPTDPALAAAAAAAAAPAMSPAAPPPAVPQTDARVMLAKRPGDAFARLTGAAPSLPAPIDTGLTDPASLRGGAVPISGTPLAVKGGVGRAVDLATGQEPRRGPVQTGNGSVRPPDAGAPVGQKFQPQAQQDPNAQRVDLGFMPRVGGGGPNPMSKLGPDYLDKMDAADKEQLGALDEAAGGLKSAQSSQAALGIGSVSETQATANELQQVQAQRDNAMQAAIAHANETAEKVRAEAEALSKQGVDPDAYWKKSTSRSILSGIAMALGAFGANMPHSGGHNPAADMINNAIAADIDAQKTNIANKWKSVSERSGLAKDELARATFTADMFDKHALMSRELLDMKLKSLLAQSNSSEQQAKLGALLAENQKAKSGLEQGMATRRYQFAMQQAAAQAAAAAGAGPSPKDLAAYRDYAKKYDELAMEGKLAVDQNGKPIPRQGFQEWYGKSLGRVLPGQGQPQAYSAPGKGNPAQEKEKALREFDQLGAGVESTAYDPRRFFGGTETGGQVFKQDAENLGFSALVKRYGGARNPEQSAIVQKMFDQPGDTEATLANKRAARRKYIESIAGNGPAPQAGGEGEK